MTTINNADLTKEIIKGASIQLSHDSVPGKLASSVVPTLEVNPKLLKACNVVKSGTRTTNGSLTIYTVPEKGQFLLSSLSLSHACDVTCDGTTTFISFKGVDGVVYYWSLIKTALVAITTAQKELNLTKPIELAPGSDIGVGAAFAAGSSSAFGMISGLYLDN